MCSELQAQADEWRPTWSESLGFGPGRGDCGPDGQPWGIDDYVPGQHCSILADGSGVGVSFVDGRQDNAPSQPQPPIAQTAERFVPRRSAHVRSVFIRCKRAVDENHKY